MTTWTDADVGLLSSVYDLQCVSRMNALYYERRLARLQTHSFWMEVVTAATASGSGLAALTLFATDPGRWAWQTLALIAAVVAVVRPIYAPGKKIETFTRQHQGYHANFFALKNSLSTYDRVAASPRSTASASTLTLTGTFSYRPKTTPRRIRSC